MELNKFVRIHILFKEYKIIINFSIKINYIENEF